MTNILLKEFCINGQFGQVRLGMPIYEVLDILGKPDHKQNFDTGSSGIMYSWYEFFYWTDNETLYAIQNDHLTTCKNLSGKKKANAHKEDITYKNDKFEIDIWFLKIGQDTTYKEVVEILKKDNIKYLEIEDASEGNIIQFDSGVRLDFDDLSGYFYNNNQGESDSNKGVIKSKEDQLLNGIRLFKP